MSAPDNTVRLYVQHGKLLAAFADGITILGDENAPLMPWQADEIRAWLAGEEEYGSWIIALERRPR